MDKAEQKKDYDLEERTAVFAESIIRLVKQIKRNPVNTSVITQLIRAGTSVGANYCEANNASSKSDFRNKIYLCKKEINETKYWLRIFSNVEIAHREKARKLWKEAQELNMIFQSIVNSLNNKKN